MAKKSPQETGRALSAVPAKKPSLRDLPGHSPACLPASSPAFSPASSSASSPAYPPVHPPPYAELHCISNYTFLRGASFP
ncbi:MAG: hypothetical protein KJN90_08180, partial [Gammaproteobacteria bacterium]|nr:hypothetical protein [Gammaproteobacteria bacterium]